MAKYETQFGPNGTKNYNSETIYLKIKEIKVNV